MIPTDESEAPVHLAGRTLKETRHVCAFFNSHQERDKVLMPFFKASDDCLRDVVALAMLPAMWTGAQPLRVVESLAAALFSALDPQFAYVCMNGAPGEPSIAVAQINRYQASPGLAEEAGPAIGAWAANHDPDERLLLRSRSGDAWTVAVRPLGANAELGVIAAAFPENAAPTPAHDLLLTVAASQAVNAIQNTMLLHSLRLSETALRQNEADAVLLQTIGAEMVRQDDVQALYEKIVDAAATLMRSQYASMQMLYPQRGTGGELKLLACRGFNPNATQFWQWVRADSQSTCGEALRTGRRAIAADVNTCPYMAGSEDLAAYLQTGIRAVQTTPLLGRSGKLVGMISTHWDHPHEPSERELRNFDILARQAADLIDRMKAAEALRQHGERFRKMIDALPAAIYTTDSQGRLTHFNPACVELSGRTPELGSDHWCVTWKLYHPDGTPMPHDACPMAIALKEGRVIQGTQAIAERPDGTRVWFEPYPTVLRDADGAIVGGINMLLDITARKQAEEALRQSEDRLRMAIECTQMGTWDYNPLTGALRWDDRCKALFGLPRDADADYPTFLSAVHPEDRQRTREADQRALDPASGGSYDIEYRAIGIQDGVERWIASRGEAFFGPDGQSSRFIGTVLDVTTRKHAQEQLQRAMQAADAANQAKDRFLAVLSHELRTPLSPVLLTVTALEHDADLPFNLRDDLAMVRRNIELETKLIDDLLDLSRVSSGKLRLHRQPVEVHELLRHVAQSSARETSAKRLTVELDLQARHDQMDADPARLQQVFWNLLRNAIKFTPDGGSITIRTDNAPDGALRVRVLDTGIGIPPELLSRIFDAFEQGESSTTRRFGGLGLGLAVSKAIVELHGGTIRAESAGEGRGSAVIVELPAAQASEPRPHPLDRHPDHLRRNGGLRVLLVEDHADTAMALSKLLRRSGYCVKTAGSVCSALELAAAEKFDVIVSDLGLPDGTGYELMEQVRGRHGLKGIALSGYGMEEDLRRSKQAGFIEHIVKPVNVAQLDSAIRQLFEAEHERA